MMELKTYTKNQNLVNIDKLTKQIASSGFVSGIVAITVFGFDVTVHGDSLNNEAGLDALIESYNFASPIVPKAITPRQARSALFISGITNEMVVSAINTLPSPTKELALITWEFSVEFHRDNPLVATMATMLGWTSDQIDQLWIGASQIP